MRVDQWSTDQELSSEIMSLLQDSVDDGAGMAMDEITSEAKGGETLQEWTEVYGYTHLHLHF